MATRTAQPGSVAWLQSENRHFLASSPMSAKVGLVCIDLAQPDIAAAERELQAAMR